MMLEVSLMLPFYNLLTVLYFLRYVLKKTLWHRCFPMNFAKFLRMHFLKEHLRWLLLSIDFDQVASNRTSTWHIFQHTFRYQ